MNQLVIRETLFVHDRPLLGELSLGLLALSLLLSYPRALRCSLGTPLAFGRLLSVGTCHLLTPVLELLLAAPHLSTLPHLRDQ
jgi:hypothetical protein